MKEEWKKDLNNEKPVVDEDEIYQITSELTGIPLVRISGERIPETPAYGR